MGDVVKRVEAYSILQKSKTSAERASIARRRIYWLRWQPKIVLETTIERWGVFIPKSLIKTPKI